MATTTAPARQQQPSEGETPAGTGPASPSPAAAPPAAPGAAPSESSGAPPAAPETGYEPGKSLLIAPNYDNIVGGVPPSPYASLMLLGGLLCLVASAVGTARGADMLQWWVLGALLIAAAVFLAGFVSRS